MRGKSHKLNDEFQVMLAGRNGDRFLLQRYIGGRWRDQGWYTDKTKLNRALATLGLPPFTVSPDDAEAA